MFNTQYIFNVKLFVISWTTLNTTPRTQTNTSFYPAS